MSTPKPEPVKCKPGPMAELVSDPKLAEAVEQALDTIRSYCTIDRSTLRTLLDSWRQRGEECNDRNHVGLREFITGFRDVPAERGQDVALVAFKFERLKAELAAANKRLTFLQECIRLHHGGEPHEHE